MRPNLQKITAIQTIAVRHPVLRAGKPIQSCHFEGDELPTTHHFGCYIADKIVGVISVFQVNPKDFTTSNGFQIRGMAVLEDFQKQGIGAHLVQVVETFCLQQKAEIIWFNARTSAVGFYQKMGYAVSGTEFEIKEVGPHFLMYKWL